MKLSMPTVLGTTVAAGLLISGVVAAQTTDTGNIYTDSLNIGGQLKAVHFSNPLYFTKEQ